MRARVGSPAPGCALTITPTQRTATGSEGPSFMATTFYHEVTKNTKNTKNRFDHRDTEPQSHREKRECSNAAVRGPPGTIYPPPRPVRPGPHRPHLLLNPHRPTSSPPPPPSRPSPSPP